MEIKRERKVKINNRKNWMGVIVLRRFIHLGQQQLLMRREETLKEYLVIRKSRNKYKK
jgi:hypothetical protein